MGCINTIMLIDENQKRKEYFIEKLKQKVNFSYTKGEVVFQTINELYEKKSLEKEKEFYLTFFNKFIEQLSKSQGFNLIDVDKLSIENSSTLLKQHDNLMVIYLQKITNEDNIIQIDGNKKEEIDNLIKKIVN